jgi:hypothetical protein
MLSAILSRLAFPASHLTLRADKSKPTTLLSLVVITGIIENLWRIGASYCRQDAFWTCTTRIWSPTWKVYRGVSLPIAALLGTLVALIFIAMNGQSARRARPRFENQSTEMPWDVGANLLLFLDRCAPSSSDSIRCRLPPVYPPTYGCRGGPDVRRQ